LSVALLDRDALRAGSDEDGRLPARPTRCRSR
jgi:hypothetical protein